MLRNFGITLALFGLLLAGYDGFRIRERVQTSTDTSATTGTEGALVHSADAAIIPPN